MAIGVVVREGVIADYDRLAQFHYRAGRPATVVKVLISEERGRPIGRKAEPIGVLVVSMPARFGPWRERAWPGVFAGAAEVNAGLRVISRVVVEPRWRGLGVARRLVCDYLADPLTRHTETIAAMGRVCPVFERAGMRRVAWAPSRRVVRLRVVLRELEIEPWMLVDPRALLEGLPSSGRSRLASALRTFARAHGETRDRADTGVDELIELAARRVACEPAVFVTP